MATSCRFVAEVWLKKTMKNWWHLKTNDYTGHALPNGRGKYKRWTVINRQELKMTCILLWKNVSVGWHCPAVDWRGGDGYSNRSQAACQAVNIDSAVVFVGGATWLDNRVTEQHASRHAVAFSLSIWATQGTCWYYIVLTQPQESVKCRWIKWLGCIELARVMGLYLSAGPSCACAAHSLRQSRNHTQREKKKKKSERDSRAEGGEQRCAAWGGLWFYLHLQPSSHK